MPGSIRTLFILILLLPVARQLDADDLFRVEAVGGGTTVVVTGNSLPDLLLDIGDVAGQFSALSGQAFVADVDYAGILSAIRVRYDPGAGPGQATLVIERLLGSDASLIPVFDEANGDLGEQLEDYFLKFGSDLIANFQRAVATQSAVGVVSGNPVSAVGRLMGYRERRFGTGRIRFRDDGSSGGGSAGARALILGSDDGEVDLVDGVESGGSDSGFTSSVAFTGYGLEAGGYSGTAATIEPSLALDLGDDASVVLGLPFGWTGWQGSNSWTLGMQLDIPITLVHHEGNPAGKDTGSPDIRWSIVPGGGVVGAFSYELIQGGLLWNVGALNLIEIYDENDSFSFSQQYLHMDSLSLEYEGYVLDYGTTQNAMQFGFRYARRLSGRCAVYVGTSWSVMLGDDAWTQDWFSPQAGLAWSLDGGGLISLGFEGQIGDNDWQALGGQLSFVLPF